MRSIYGGIYYSPFTNHKILVVKLAREKLDITKSYRGQSKKNVQQLIEMVSYSSSYRVEENLPILGTKKACICSRLQRLLADPRHAEVASQG
jgi:hypothetical protein